MVNWLRRLIWGRGWGCWERRWNKRWKNGRRKVTHISKLCLLKIDEKTRGYGAMLLRGGQLQSFTVLYRTGNSVWDKLLIPQEIHGYIHFRFRPCMCNWCETTDKPCYWHPWFVGCASSTGAGCRHTAASRPDGIIWHHGRHHFLALHTVQLC